MCHHADLLFVAKEITLKINFNEMTARELQKISKYNAETRLYIW